MDSGGEVAWSEVNQAFDPRSWLAGTTYPAESAFRLPADLKPGDYDLRIALVDETGQPRVRLGIEGADPALRYQLGSVRIANAKN
jgi:hypothetical protein